MCGQLIQRAISIDRFTHSRESQGVPDQRMVRRGDRLAELRLDIVYPVSESKTRTREKNSLDLGVAADAHDGISNAVSTDASYSIVISLVERPENRNLKTVVNKVLSDSSVDIFTVWGNYADALTFKGTKSSEGRSNWGCRLCLGSPFLD